MECVFPPQNGFEMPYKISIYAEICLLQWIFNFSFQNNFCILKCIFFDITSGQHISLILVKSGKKLSIRTSAISMRPVLNEQNFDTEINPSAYKFEEIASSFPLP